MKGDLNWEQQKRFFHCIHGTLDLIVNQKVFTHDPNRDYFTKEEVVKLFHLYFKYDQETSHRFTEQLLAVKRILVGGSQDRLKDKELSALYNLIYVYRDVYFIMHKQIPVFAGAFSDDSTITAEQKTKSLTQIKKAFKLLESAYKLENISYPIKDIYRFGDYFKQAGFLKHDQKTDRGFSFLHYLIDGIVSPQEEIANEQWNLFFNTFYKTLELLLYYKTYFTKGLTDLESVYVKLESARLFLSLFPIENEAEKFPLDNLDKMLYSLVSFFEEQSDSETFLSSLKNKDSIRLFTRTLTCFSLNKSIDKNCESEWKKESSVVRVSFPDTDFDFFPESLKVKSHLDSSQMFFDFETKNLLNNWIHNYKKALSDLHKEQAGDIAIRYQVDHWLDPFFKWEKSNQLIFGDLSFEDSSRYKTYNLLNYKAFLSLFFSSYMPDSYFSNSDKSISFTVWKDMVTQVSPLLVILGGNEEYKISWRKSFYDLFYIADSFLNSSNRDERLNFKEFIDLTVHLLSSIEKSNQAFEIVSRFCARMLDSECVTTAILKEPDILSSYPRFQSYVFDFQEPVYKEKIQNILGVIEKDSFTSFQLTPLLFFIQVMELNYHLIDRDQSFKLDSKELLAFSSQFTDSINQQIPYVLNDEQALSYLMYSFKTGNMPFFTGSEFDAIHYTHWHLYSKISQAFTITPNDFHFLLFDFYNLYKQF